MCKNGVALATDTRATMGYTVASKRARKIYKITDTIAATVAGGVADTQDLVNILRAEANYFALREGALMGVRAAARLTANVLHVYRLFPYFASLLVAGVGAGGPKLYFVDMDGTLTEETMVATGSGSPIAYGLLETEFKEGMTVEKAAATAVKAVKAAMKRDISTGDELMLVTVTKEGYREFSPEEIKNLIA